MMIAWIEAQSTAVIGVLTFAMCYALAACILAATALVAHCRVGGEFKFIIPVLLTPISVIAGLLIAFLAARVWTNLDHAQGYVAAEASAIREAALLADALPDPVRRAVRADLRQHLAFIDDHDWPDMLAGRANFRRPPQFLTEAQATLLGFDAATSGQRVAQERSVVAIERALEARRGRILLSNAVVSPAQWAVIFILDGVILTTIGFVHIDRRWTAAAAMALYSTALAACLMLLLIHDRPFAVGGYVLQPEALHQLGAD
ncbi:MAG: hypothetical protein U1E70_22095 [Acetobacteraceae bacterium]|nr:DUF4239 domain-containing protein [Pseudomonadota bacterium]